MLHGALLAFATERLPVRVSTAKRQQPAWRMSAERPKKHPFQSVPALERAL
jgi:hypothetical protein